MPYFCVAMRHCCYRDFQEAWTGDYRYAFNRSCPLPASSERLLQRVSFRIPGFDRRISTSGRTYAHHPKAVTESAQQSGQVAPKIPVLTKQSNRDLNHAEQLGIDYVQSYPFAPDARVAGYLIKADIEPTSYGFLHGADLPPGENFVTIEAIGVDSCGGYDMVGTDAGVAYVIVTFAMHARERGLDHLKDHIGANPDHYAVRSLILGNPWPNTQEVIDQIEAGWRRPLSPVHAGQRLETLCTALAEVQRT